MGKLITIQKTVTAQAVKINSPEEDALVREWLAEMFEQGIDGISPQEAVELAQSQELAPVIDAQAWFARDNGSPVVYIIPPEQFVVNFEEISEEDIPAAESESFKFEEN